MFSLRFISLLSLVMLMGQFVFAETPPQNQKFVLSEKVKSSLRKARTCHIQIEIFINNESSGTSELKMESEQVILNCDGELNYGSLILGGIEPKILAGREKQIAEFIESQMQELGFRVIRRKQSQNSNSIHLDLIRN